MEFNVQFVKWKWLWTKDSDLGKFYIWVNWSNQLWIKLLTTWNSIMKLKVWNIKIPCFIWDSTTPYRGTKNDSVLVQLMIEIEPLEVWNIFINTLLLIIE
jgi:hypothetical protein